MRRPVHLTSAIEPAADSATTTASKNASMQAIGSPLATAARTASDASGDPAKDAREAMLKDELKAKILALVESSEAHAALYGQLAELDGFNGPCTLAHPKFPKILFWQGLSEPAAQAILELTQEGLIAHTPVDEIAYIAQGKTLDLPLFTAKIAAHAADLHQAHWMPVSLVPGPFASQARGAKAA